MNQFLDNATESEDLPGFDSNREIVQKVGNIEICKYREGWREDRIPI